MKTISIALAFGVLATSAVAADQPCVTGERRGGVDFSMPCHWHSPVPAEDTAVRFPSGAWNLSPEAEAILDRQAAILARFPSERIELVGYADAQEAPSTDQRIALGKKRAESVRTHLMRQGIQPSRITVRGSDTPVLIPRERTPETLAKMRVVYTKTSD